MTLRHYYGRTTENRCQYIPIYIMVKSEDVIKRFASPQKAAAQIKINREARP